MTLDNLLALVRVDSRVSLFSGDVEAWIVERDALRAALLGLRLEGPDGGCFVVICPGGWRPGYWHIDACAAARKVLGIEGCGS